MFEIYQVCVCTHTHTYIYILFSLQSNEKILVIIQGILEIQYIFVFLGNKIGYNTFSLEIFNVVQKKKKKSKKKKKLSICCICYTIRQFLWVIPNIILLFYSLYFISFRKFFNQSNFILLLALLYTNLCKCLEKCKLSFL